MQGGIGCKFRDKKWLPGFGNFNVRAATVETKATPDGAIQCGLNWKLNIYMLESKQTKPTKLTVSLEAQQLDLVQKSHKSTLIRAAQRNLWKYETTATE